MSIPEGRELYRVLQISDLHFGHKLEGLGKDALSAQLPDFLKYFPWLDGMLGHHYRALSALKDFCKPILEGKSNCLLIVSGDLTANGAIAQFDLAQSYLSGRWSDPTIKLGLDCPAWVAASISGNHDNWPGSNRILGNATAGLTKYLGSYPLISPLTQLANGFSLRFLFIDSDADVNPYGLKRLLAQGHFLSQLKSLRDKIPDLETHEIRILVIHHSLSPRLPEDDVPPQGARVPRVLEITPSSRRVLDRLLLELDIKVVLSGHMHVPRLCTIPVSNGAESGVVLEARCGTTTQRDRYPDDIYKSISPDRQLPPNTLMLHKIIEKNQATFWRAEIFWLNRRGKFVDDTNYSTKFLPGQLKIEFPL